MNTITVTLIPFFTKELVHEGWGSPRPLYKAINAAPHQAGGLMTCQQATKTPRMAGAPRYKLEQLSSTAHKAHNLALTLKLELA